MKKNFSSFFAILIASIIISVFLITSQFQHSALEEYKETRSFFGTYVTIHCFYEKSEDRNQRTEVRGQRPKGVPNAVERKAKNINRIIEECWDRLQGIQESMSAHSKTGDVALINTSGYNGVEVSKDVYAVLKDSIEFSRLANGAFDVTVFPLIEIWKSAAENGIEPDKEAIKIALEKCGYENIELEPNNTVILKKQGMKIDLGGIAKGYAVDEAAKILKGNGIEDFLIDAGGDILCAGLYEGRKPWRVGVRDPAEKDRIIDALKIKDMAVTTSGDYERFYEIGGVRYSHIIDPSAGYPQDKVISATVIAPTAQEADAFSTALCVMGAKQGINFINNLDNLEAMVIEREDGREIIYTSRGYRKISICP